MKNCLRTMGLMGLFAMGIATGMSKDMPVKGEPVSNATMRLVFMMDKGNFPGMIAAIKDGADVNVTDGKGNTVLLYVVNHYGAEYPKNSESALANLGNTLTLLRTRGLNFNNKNNFGDTIGHTLLKKQMENFLHFTNWNMGIADILAALCKVGFNMSNRNNANKTVLELAREYLNEFQQKGTIMDYRTQVKTDKEVTNLILVFKHFIDKIEAACKK